MNFLKFSTIIILISVAALFIGCSGMGINVSAGDKYKDKEYYRQTPPSLNPGSAFITSTVIKSTENDDHFLCTVRVEKVNETGPGTPPLTKGRKLGVMISKSLINEKSPLDILIKDKILILTLSAPEKTQDDYKKKPWNAIRIH